MTHTNVKRIETAVKFGLALGLLALVLALQGCAASQAHSTRAEAAAERVEVVWKEDKEAHLCGAQTKAGKACTRRVKRGELCWQHRAKK